MDLPSLAQLSSPTSILALTADQLKELQRALSVLGYTVGKIDGLIGPRTRTAWALFKRDAVDGNPDLIGPTSVSELKRLVDKIWGVEHDCSSTKATLASIALECSAIGLGLNTQIAYVLATVEWETAKTFAPVREAFWLSEDWRKEHLRYYPYYGRGYVQLTWRDNYAQYGDILGLDLVGTPDLALQGEVALFVLAHGFKTGAFTGHKLTEFINSTTTDFERARCCINGTDHAADIARLAQKYMPQA